MPNNENQQENIVQKKAKKLIRDRAIKVGKKVGKAAIRVAAKALLAAGKALISIVAGIGAPYLLLIAGIVVGVFLIFIATSLIFSSNPNSLNAEGKALRTAIIQAADNTVDMRKEEQIPFRVPHELLIATMQIYDSDGNVKSKKAATELADALRPIFEYETVEGIYEMITTTCVDGSECTSTTSNTTFELTFLVKVDAWDRLVNWEISSEKTPWETIAFTRETMEDDDEDEDNNKEITITVDARSDFFFREEMVIMDYTIFDSQLTLPPFDYGHESKLAVEAIYEITGGEIFYKEWLTDNSLIGFDGTIIPGSNIPTEYMEYYLAASKKYNVDWYYIAAIHFVETGFSTHPTMISSVGAEGHMQFMPCTWLGWSYSGCQGGLGGISIPDAIKHSPTEIRKYGGYGVDADGDGIANPWNIKDAIFSAANLLNKEGFSKNIEGAIKKYNHSNKYVADVVAKAKEFRDQSQYIPIDGSVPNLAPGSFMRPALGRVSSPYGPRVINGKPGNFHYGVDIANPINTPIVAVADGVVSKVHTGCPQKGHKQDKCGGGWGNHVFVQHTVQGQVYEAVYAHFTKPAVTRGQQIKQGQMVGYMGMSGMVTGVHLHLELYRGPRSGYKNVLNPAFYIPL